MMVVQRLVSAFRANFPLVYAGPPCVLFIAFALSGCTSEPESAFTPSEPSEKLNVVWILLDTLRADRLGSYGYDRDTSPNIDRLAELGTLFENHYAQAPNTVLSVPTYMTGKYFPAFYQDSHFLGAKALRLPVESERTAAAVFRENGYTTAMFSSSPWYTPESRLAKTFDHFENLMLGHMAPGPDFTRYNPELFEWMDEHAEEPFFLYVHTLDAHKPRGRFNTHTTWLDASFPESRDNQLRDWSGGPYSAADQEHIRNLYDGGVSYADYTVGTIVQHLEKLGIRDNTLIVISSDHGEVLAEDGETLGHPGHQSHEELLRTPFIISGGNIPAGGRVASRSRNIDILPTLMGLLGLSSTGEFDGASLAPRMESESADDSPEMIYAKTDNEHFQREPHHVLIAGDWKFEFKPFYEEGKTSRKSSAEVLDELTVWKMPDRAERRERAVPIPGQAADKAHQYLAEALLPKWEVQDKQPMDEPQFIQFDHWDKSIENKVTELDESDDGKWTMLVDRTDFLHGKKTFFISYGASDQVSDLAFVRNLENGRYRLEILASTWEQDGRQQPTSVIVRLGQKQREDRTFGFVSITPQHGPIRTEQWIDLGEITVNDGKFYYGFYKNHQSGRIAVAGPMRVTKISGVTDAERKEQDELLETLGYLN